MSLDDLRKRIDELDDAILRALDERARVVSDVGRAKRDANLPTYDPDRERLILDRLAARAGRFPPEAIRAVYREVMSACLALQEPLKIAYLGPEGTFSHAAAREIDMIGPGTARVRIEVIRMPEVLEGAGFAVQVGAFRDRRNAERMRSRMETRYGSARLVFRPGNPEVWRVLVGAESTESQANTLADRIRRESDEKTAPFVVRLDSV